MNAMTAYCARCACQVESVGGWAGFLWLKRGWYVGIGAIAVLSPIVFSELTVLIPLACMFGMAAGPVHSLAAERATCRHCGGLVR